MASIDLDGPDPLYVQAASVVRSRIADGTYPVDRRIPSEAELSDDLGISRPTIWKAMRLLKAEGIIRGVPGRGTFVVEKPAED